MDEKVKEKLTQGLKCCVVTHRCSECPYKYKNNTVGSHCIREIMALSFEYIKESEK